jgi:alpha-galactosidase
VDDVQKSAVASMPSGGHVSVGVILLDTRPLRRQPDAAIFHFAMLSSVHPRFSRLAGDMQLSYCLESDGTVTFSLLPASRAGEVVEKRIHLDAPEILQLPSIYLPMPARAPDPLVQLHVRGMGPPAAFAQGRTMRGGEAAFALKLAGQRIDEDATGLTLTTLLEAAEGFAAEHVLHWETGAPYLRMWTVVHNRSAAPLTLDMLASFSFSGVTPFAPDDAPGRLRIHRLRSGWSAEGRLESRSVEDLHLERSWTGHGVFCERFGQVGSMPVRGFFPFVAVEDTAAGVLWGVQLELASSWQLEIYRRGDDLAVSGGLADREFGHWWKTLAPGESFVSPKAVLSTVSGDLETLHHRLTRAQQSAAQAQPVPENELPAVFNEWCSSWGNPTHESVVATARAIAPLGLRYLVIDDGWAERPGDHFQQNGDWNINRRAFPDGLRATCEEVRKLGVIPGLWFEFEVCNEGSRAWGLTDHQLRRDGQVLRVGNRRFWDFRDPWTHAYLADKVIRLLRENGFGYLKVDYNETIGLGCDGAESPGEGLRQHIAGVREFFREIRRHLPDLVIENCSSGGHRLEPSMMELCAMGSFSDAHETVEIPIIAANLHRVILPRQCQVWAVLRATDPPQRTLYSLAATLLGRLTISGDITNLTAFQIDAITRTAALHRAAAPVIRDGFSRRFGELGESFRHPTGWQALRRVAADGQLALVVLHTFAAAPAQPMVVPLPPGNWQIATVLAASTAVLWIEDNALVIPPLPDFSGLAILLTPS